jgi:hypothetical protein
MLFLQEKALSSPGYNKMLCGAFKGGTSGLMSQQSSAVNLLLDHFVVKTPKNSELLNSPCVSRQADDTASFFIGNSRASTRLSEMDKAENLPSLPFVDIKDESSDSSVLVISPYESSWPVESSRDSSNIDGCLTDQSSQSSSSSASALGMKRSLSVTSEDSISQELVHFKPIHASPCTPPRTLPNGKLAAQPPLVRTVPYNLSAKITDNQPNAHEIPSCCPIMCRRLGELAVERNEQVGSIESFSSVLMFTVIFFPYTGESPFQINMYR